MIKNNLKKNRGYTLLFAVIVSSIVLSVGISILTISKKEFLLTSAARESVSAFYAADSGLECAIFNDSIISTSSPGVTFNCMRQVINPTLVFPNTFPGGNDGKGVFDFDVKTGVKSCVKVNIEKYYEGDVGNSVPGVTIISRGYNVGWNGTNLTCSVSSPARVERAIRYKY